jgi:hypothetical protein
MKVICSYCEATFFVIHFLVQTQQSRPLLALHTHPASIFSFDILPILLVHVFLTWSKIIVWGASLIKDETGETPWCTSWLRYDVGGFKGQPRARSLGLGIVLGEPQNLECPRSRKLPISATKQRFGVSIPSWEYVVVMTCTIEMLGI